MKKLIATLLSFFIYSSMMAQEKVSREDLLEALLYQEKVSQVAVKKVVLPKGLASGKHLHPCPVVGYIAAGSVVFQVEGEEKKILKQGDAFYEPKNKTILHFDNASKEDPLVFIAFYLKEGDEALIQLLDK
jgi:quercetin dioxygenase-like cupin family protein